MTADAARYETELARGFGADHVVERGTDVAGRIGALAHDGVIGLVDGSTQTTKTALEQPGRGGAGTPGCWSGSRQSSPSRSGLWMVGEVLLHFVE
ncbi:hypothetical protein [Streptomyces sp. NBRC 110028]|uniref:hypothetical protein n=1 Tax=Streptomyces sp. NBRC 110028 TaxID=1621260 RepID=UPI000A937719|nr:hypothetical protein [Streptomyces sp. NBRC 110028]